MTKVTFYQNSENQCVGFTSEDHAGYAQEGKDIVCAGISALVINTINSIEEFTDDPFTCDCRDGMIESWEFTNDLSAATELLMDSLMLGLTNIVEAYGEEYLKVEMVEK